VLNFIEILLSLQTLEKCAGLKDERALKHIRRHFGILIKIEKVQRVQDVFQVSTEKPLSLYFNRSTLQHVSVLFGCTRSKYGKS